MFVQKFQQQHVWFFENHFKPKLSLCEWMNGYKHTRTPIDKRFELCSSVWGVNPYALFIRIQSRKITETSQCPNTQYIIYPDTIQKNYWNFSLSKYPIIQTKLFYPDKYSSCNDFLLPKLPILCWYYWLVNLDGLDSKKETKFECYYLFPVARGTYWT